MATGVDNSHIKVLVTGASGFIASHVVQQLQQEGYQVRGTVRSLRNVLKCQPLYQLCPQAKCPLELVEADLLDETSWIRAVHGCQYVMHVASPVPIKHPKNENEVIKPAVDGTLNILKACSLEKCVKRVVLTSSVAAVNGEAVPGKHDESRWTDLKLPHLDTYSKSKTLAEKAAWDFVANLSSDDKFELAVINPVFVTGPVLTDALTSSMEIPKRLLERLMIMVPNINFPTVDVRDVATAHIRAMLLPEAVGHRHICSNDAMRIVDVAKILAQEFDPQGYNVPTKVAPNLAVSLIALFDKSLKIVLPALGKVMEFDNSRMLHVLGIKPVDIKESVLTMAYTMIERGLIKRTKKYKGPNVTTSL